MSVRIYVYKLGVGMFIFMFLVGKNKYGEKQNNIRI